MPRLLLLILVPALALAVGCSGGDDDEDGAAPGSTDGAATTAALDPEQFGTEDPQFGRLLLRFTKEAQAGDVLGMWNMLSSATQASIGPSLPEFRKRQALDFEKGVGSLARTAEVVVSRRIGDFGLAAVSAETQPEGKTLQYAYAVAFLEEEGEWKIELGGIIITGLRPEPLAQADPQPAIAADVGSGESMNTASMFLDSEPLAARREDDPPFAAKLRGKPSEPLEDGWHTVVTFADTGLTASAIAWTFSVGDAQG